ncbi:MAG: yecA family protein [Rhizobacter sp.]|nr:yecA family protein [Rhizobacter sp.]
MKPHPPNRRAPPPPPPRPLDEQELEFLQKLLDSVPKPLEALDVTMLDGFLCGVLLQPRTVPPAQWLPFVTDMEGRPLPPSFRTDVLHELVRRRWAELDGAINEREWFDPWVFELEEEASPSEVVYPWVAGFAAAAEEFPGLMGMDESLTVEPLALLYQHLDPDDLEDADALMAEIETLEPPVDVSEAVEHLVRATLLLADVSRPIKEDEPKPAAPPHPAAKRMAQRQGGAGSRPAAGKSAGGNRPPAKGAAGSRPPAKKSPKR